MFLVWCVEGLEVVKESVEVVRYAAAWYPSGYGGHFGAARDAVKLERRVVNNLQGSKMRSTKEHDASVIYFRGGTRHQELADV